VKELIALAAGLPTIFQDREDVWLERLAATGARRRRGRDGTMLAARVEQRMKQQSTAKMV